MPNENNKPTPAQLIPYNTKDADTNHLIVFDVYSCFCPVGTKGERIKLYLSDKGYERALASQADGEMKIISYEKVHHKPRATRPPHNKQER